MISLWTIRVVLRYQVYQIYTPRVNYHVSVIQYIINYIFQSNEFYWFLAGVAANSLSVLNAIKLDFETILHKRGSNL